MKNAGAKPACGGEPVPPLPVHDLDIRQWGSRRCTGAIKPVPVRAEGAGERSRAVGSWGAGRATVRSCPGLSYGGNDPLMCVMEIFSPWSCLALPA